MSNGNEILNMMDHTMSNYAVMFSFYATSGNIVINITIIHRNDNNSAINNVK